MATIRSSTRQRKAPIRFDDDERFFPPPRKIQSKKKSSVKVVAVPVLLTATLPPTVVKVPGAPRRRKGCDCGEPECDCFEIEMKKWIATRKMKSTEVIKTAK
ncbi:unnamed protein product [Caenorhabditis brenneri]